MSQLQLYTGADNYYAAMILQHGEKPEDYLLAHELCIVAISKREAKAKWLAAATEDRFLMMIGHPQRFATQFRADKACIDFMRRIRVLQMSCDMRWTCLHSQRRERAKRR